MCGSARIKRRRVLPSSDMAAPPQVVSAVYGLCAVLAWGTSDFLGGYATRRANAFLFTTVVNIGGLILVGALAAASHAAFPSGRSAAIPTVFSMFTEGLPGRISIVGFFLAAIGLWLITRAEDGNTPEGIGLALFAGTGFAGFYLCVRQAGEASPFWIATLTRTGALVITGLIV